MTLEERKAFAKQPIIWKGNLSDDCTAVWAGLMLRAEWMDEDYWWWAVYDELKNETTIDDSNNYSEQCLGGEIARQKAKNVARAYLIEITI